LADQVLETAGFDPRTGKVVDTVRFQTWKKEQARAIPVASTLRSMATVWHARSSTPIRSPPRKSARINFAAANPQAT